LVRGFISPFILLSIPYSPLPTMLRVLFFSFLSLLFITPIPPVYAQTNQEEPPTPVVDPTPDDDTTGDGDGGEGSRPTDKSRLPTR
jgi:hypothetical protein